MVDKVCLAPRDVALNLDGFIDNFGNLFLEQGRYENQSTKADRKLHRRYDRVPACPELNKED